MLGMLDMLLILGEEILVIPGINWDARLVRKLNPNTLLML